MDWEIIDNLLERQIEQCYSLQKGFQSIKDALKIDFSVDIFEGVDEARLQSEFNEWVLEIFRREEIPKNIRSIYFGIFTMADQQVNSGEETTTIHVCGSVSEPDEDDDWACDTGFLPDNRYLVLTDFMIVDNNLKSKVQSNGALQVLIFNGLLNLLIINSIADTGSRLLKKHTALYIGAGYDEGEPYVIGKLTQKGLNKI